MGRSGEMERQPLARPGWLLPWWRSRVREGSSRSALRAVVVCDGDGDGLAGPAPLFIEDRRARWPHLRFLGPPAFWGCSPLVRSDGADRTIDAITAASAPMRPRPSVVAFEFLDDDSRWRGAVVERW